MVQRLIDNTVLNAFSVMFQIAVFALKRRRSSAASSSAQHGMTIRLSSDQTDRVLAVRPLLFSKSGGFSTNV